MPTRPVEIGLTPIQVKIPTQGPGTRNAVAGKHVIAVLSGKGGVGKTTIALAVAALWARDGLSVALVDLDPQAGATLASGVPRSAAPLRAAPQRSHGVMLYPSGRALAASSVEDLSRHLAAATHSASLTLIDLSPALTDASHVAALRHHASFALVVARTDAAGLANAEEAVELCTQMGCPYLVALALKGHTSLAREAEAFLRGRFGARVAQTTVPLDARAAEAAAAKKPVPLFARNSRAGLALESLAREILDHMERAP